MNIRIILLASMAILPGVLLVQSVFASGIATLQGKNARDSTMEVEYLDRSKVRMNVPDKQGGNSYMLMSDGKVYMVSNSRGETIVMDMAQLGSMAKGMGMNMGGSDSFKQELLKYNKTGRSETVAGYKGDVYSLTWHDSRGTHTDEAVLSGHQNVREFSEAWMNLAETMANSMGQRVISDKSIWNFLRREGKGVLRLGDDFRVVSIESKNINVSRFVLPAAPMLMPTIGGMGRYPTQVPSGNAGSTASPQKQPGSAEQQQSSYWGSLLGQKTERQAERQQNHAERSVDHEVDKAVDKAIGGVLKGIFGR